VTKSISHLPASLPASLEHERHDDVSILRLARPHKRNALNDETVLGIERFLRSSRQMSAP
jgi:(methylthio)acryloyl-CoA hydratase